MDHSTLRVAVDVDVGGASAVAAGGGVGGDACE